MTSAAAPVLVDALDSHDASARRGAGVQRVLDGVVRLTDRCGKEMH